MMENMSPNSKQIIDLEDECYSAISLKTATLTNRLNSHQITTSTSSSITPYSMSIDPKSLLLTAPASTTVVTKRNCSPAYTSVLSGRGTNPALNSHGTTSTASSSKSMVPQIQQHNLLSYNRLATLAKTYNLRALEHDDDDNMSDAPNTLISNDINKQERQLILQKLFANNETTATLMENDCSASTASEDNEGSASTDICSDIEIDESYIKDEPMTPGSSYPPSPELNEPSSLATAAKLNKYSTGFSLTMGNIAAFINSDLVFEHKNGCLQLTPSSQEFLKAQKLNLELAAVSSTSCATVTTRSSNVKNKNIIIPKINTKKLNTTCALKVNGNHVTYGLPLTPPASIPSDESEGNTTPEHLIAPLSPNTSNINVHQQVQTSQDTKARAYVVSSAATTATTTLAITSVTSSLSSTARANLNGVSTVNYMAMLSASSAASSSSSITSTACRALVVGTNNSSTRQPIHTSLISSQPKGSTGVLILTEEEKRTLLAEGYPIPQQLPLSKAEEKSLKKIRRKIKNKISAQESRRKKKEYMDQLERRVEILVNENNEYKKRIEALEISNISLLEQLHKLQNMIS